MKYTSCAPDNMIKLGNTWLRGSSIESIHYSKVSEPDSPEPAYKLFVTMKSGSEVHGFVRDVDAFVMQANGGSENV